MGLDPVVPKSPQGQRSREAFSLSLPLPSFPFPQVGDLIRAKPAGMGPTVGLDASPFSLELLLGMWKMGGGEECDRMADGLRGQERITPARGLLHRTWQRSGGGAHGC